MSRPTRHLIQYDRCDRSQKGDRETAFAYSQIVELHLPSPADGTSSFDFVEGTELSWDGRRFSIINLGESKVSLFDSQNGCRELPHHVFEDLAKRGSVQVLKPAPGQSEREKVTDLIRQAGPDAIKEAVRRYHLIAPYLNSCPPAEGTLPTRTRQRWIQQYQVAQATPGPRGNTQRRLSEASRSLLGKFIEESYETLKQKGKFVVYGEYLLECERLEVQGASYKTFAAEINRRPKYEQTLKRQGPRAAYAHEPSYYLG